MPANSFLVFGYGISFLNFKTLKKMAQKTNANLNQDQAPVFWMILTLCVKMMG